MTNRKLTSYLREHPYLLDDSFVMTTSAAQAVIDAAEHVLSFEEMIAGAKSRFPQYTAQQWAEFDRSIALGKKPRPQSKKRQRRRGQYRRHYWSAIAGLIVAIVIFLTLIPTGRSLAKAAFDYIFSVIGNQAEITQQSFNTAGDPGSNSQTSFDRAELSNMEEFESKTGLTPFLLNADWLKIVRIEDDYDADFGYTLWTYYQDREGNSIRLSQEWFTGQKMYVQTSDDAFKSVKIRNNFVLYYGVDPEDGQFGGVVMLGDSFLFIGADREISLEDVFDALR